MLIVLWNNGKCDITWSSPSLVSGERGQEVQRSCGWFDDGAAADFPANVGRLCHKCREFVCDFFGSMHFQSLFQRVPNVRAL